MNVFITKPSSFEEALELLEKEDSYILAGGTDILKFIKYGVKKPKVLIDIEDIPELNRIIEDEDGNLKIGSSTKLKELIENSSIRERFSILTEAASSVASPQIRNMGTVGGNLLQDVQCWYYKNKHFDCLRKGGDRCYAIPGEHKWYHSVFNLAPCVATWTSDLAPALAALRSKARIMNRNGEKVVSVENLYLEKPPWRDVKSTEILKEIEIPSPPPYGKFLKYRLWSANHFPIVNLAITANIEGDVCEEARIFMGGVSPTLFRASEVEDLIRGKSLEKGLIERAAESISEKATPLRNNSFKVRIVKGLVKRALLNLWEWRKYGKS